MDQSALSSLIQLIRDKSYREGEFTLASGRKSTFYIDLKPTTLHPDGAYWIGEAALDLLKKEDLNLRGVGGLTLGADPVATAVSLAARNRGKSWPAFIVRKQPKDHGTSRFIEGTENIPQGSPVLVVEDVITTGGSSRVAIERLREFGYLPVAVLVIVDREEGGAEAIRNEGLKFFSLLRIRDLRPKG